LTEEANYDRIDAIQQKVHDYYNVQFDDDILADCWVLRRDIVLAARKERMTIREQLKEDLVWLVDQIEEMTRRGAGSSAMYMNRARVAIKQIVEVL
jgi:hypothetical protein